MTDAMTLPRDILRPRVHHPDWTAVTLPQARQAVLAIRELLDARRSWQSYTPEEDGVYTTLLRLYADEGAAPALADLARRTGRDEGTIRAILASLGARDLVILDTAGGRVVGAYPFTDSETEHQVRLGARRLNAICAVDALGAGAMYGQDVEISSRCRQSGAPIRIATRDRGRAIATAEPLTTVVWSGVDYRDGCAATSICTTIAFFCNDAHLDAWRAAHHPDSAGFRLALDEALEVGRALFAPVLAGVENGR